MKCPSSTVRPGSTARPGTKVQHGGTVPSRRRQATLAAVALSLALGTPTWGAPAAYAAPRPVPFSEVWSRAVTVPGPISTSSPNLAILGNRPAVVVGSNTGYVYAYDLATGATVPGWPVATVGHASVISTPSVAALSRSSPNDSVFVGAGSPAHPRAGGYEAFGPNGARMWFTAASGPAQPAPLGVAASLAVGDLQGGTDVVAPSMGQYEDALDARTGKVLKGFPWFSSDSGFSTPALVPLYGPRDYIVQGAGQTAGLAYEVRYTQGGHLMVLSPTGNAGYADPNGGLKCEYNPNQEVDSSPAVGPFLPGGALGIAVGTGTYWKGASDTDMLYAFTTSCRVAWSRRLDGSTSSSPALADLTGTGALDVVEGTNNGHGGGSIYALDGATGRALWEVPAPGEVIGGVVTANLGTGYQDVIATGTGGAEVLDGRTGAVVAVLERFVGLQNCALVTDDPDGRTGITLAGYNSSDIGTVVHFEVTGSNGADAYQQGGWPMFHHDPQLTGYSRTPVPS